MVRSNKSGESWHEIDPKKTIELPAEYGRNWEEFMDMPIGIMNEDGTIDATRYTNRNIHELLKAWSQGL